MSVLLSVSPAHRGVGMIAAAGILWGTTGVVVADLHRRGVDPVTAGFYRLAVAAAVLGVVTARRPWAAAVRRAPVGLVLTGLGLGAYQALYFVAVAQAGVAVSTVVSLGIAPVVTTLGETVLVGRRPRRSGVLAVAAGVTGLALVMGSPAPAGTRPLLGILAAVGSGAGFALTAMFVHRVARRVDPTVVTGVSTLVGAVALCPLAVVTGLGLPARPGALAAVAYLGVVTTAVAYLLFYAGMRTTAGSVAALLILLEPLVATVLARVLLDEPLTPVMVAGGALLLGAVVTASVRPVG